MQSFIQCLFPKGFKVHFAAVPETPGHAPFSFTLFKTQSGRIPINPAILAAIGHCFIAITKNADTRVWGDVLRNQRPFLAQWNADFQFFSRPKFPLIAHTFSLIFLFYHRENDQYNLCKGLAPSFYLTSKIFALPFYISSLEFLKLLTTHHQPSNPRIHLCQQVLCRPQDDLQIGMVRDKLIKMLSHEKVKGH